MATQVDRLSADIAGRWTDASARSGWIYAFLREYCFRDDTERISRSLWSTPHPPRGTRLIDIGCGPGTYARKIALLHPGLVAIGVDQSARQLRRARRHADRTGATNCRFQHGDAMALPFVDSSVDAVVASRLLMVLADHEGALAEMYRILRPGGRCFIAEPRPGLWTRIPMTVMRMVGGFTGAGLHETDDRAWGALLASQPWACVDRSEDRRYRYAICERPVA
jgi:SAM-dependent methyltransferase